MPREKYDKQKALALYLEEETAILNTYNSLTEMEMAHPEKFYRTRHLLRYHLKIINTIIRNLLALEI